MADEAQELLRLFRRLGERDRHALLAFAAFLAGAEGPAATPAPPDRRAVVPEPESIPRPDQESVVQAVKRLARTYPMLNRQKMLNETSALVTQHVVEGRPAAEVIDDLEALFRERYRRLREATGDD